MRWLETHWGGDAITQEHVTPRAYMHPLEHGVARFRPRKEARHKLSVDTQKDLDRVRRVYEALWKGPGHLVRQRDAVAWLERGS
jgi:spore coat polysaccharide biosynthesis protein SpsF (cytidylyltransferase family)